MNGNFYEGVFLYYEPWKIPKQFEPLMPSMNGSSGVWFAWFTINKHNLSWFSTNGSVPETL